MGALCKSDGNFEKFGKNWRERGLKVRPGGKTAGGGIRSSARFRVGGARVEVGFARSRVGFCTKRRRIRTAGGARLWRGRGRFSTCGPVFGVGGGNFGRKPPGLWKRPGGLSTAGPGLRVGLPGSQTWIRARLPVPFSAWPPAAWRACPAFSRSR